MSTATGRGQERRAALVRAATALLGEGGPAAVTARAVAARARVPLAAVTYYFATVDDLVREAAQQVFEAHLAAARSVAVPDGAGWEEALVRVWFDPAPDGPDPARVRGLLEQVLSAAGTPSLRASLQRWDAEVVRLVEGVLAGAGRDTSRTRLLLAALDGAALARLGGVDARTGGPVGDGDLLGGLVADLRAVVDDLAPRAAGV